MNMKGCPNVSGFSIEAQLETWIPVCRSPVCIQTSGILFMYRPDIAAIFDDTEIRIQQHSVEDAASSGLVSYLASYC